MAAKLLPCFTHHTAPFIGNKTRTREVGTRRTHSSLVCRVSSRAAHTRVAAAVTRDLHVPAVRAARSPTRETPQDARHHVTAWREETLQLVLIKKFKTPLLCV